MQCFYTIDTNAFPHVKSNRDLKSLSTRTKRSMIFELPSSTLLELELKRFSIKAIQQAQLLFICQSSGTFLHLALPGT